MFLVVVLFLKYLCTLSIIFLELSLLLLAQAIVKPFPSKTDLSISQHNDTGDTW